MNISREQMLHFVSEMEDIALMALEGKVTKQALEAQFRIIRENIERWEEFAGDNI
jgi:hypothetical protein